MKPLQNLKKAFLTAFMGLTLLLCSLSLSACGAIPTPAPVVVTAPLPEGLTRCQPVPPHPCPTVPDVAAQPACSKKKVETWQALLFHALLDCKSKLARVRALQPVTVQ